jgi:hypothetical protein
MKNDSGLELSKWKKPKPGHSLEWVARRAKDTDQFFLKKIKNNIKYLETKKLPIINGSLQVQQIILYSILSSQFELCTAMSYQ